MSNMAMKKIELFSTSQLTTFLKKNDLGDLCDIISTTKVDGTKFLKLTEFEIQVWRSKISQQQIKKLNNFLKQLKANPQKFLDEDPYGNTEIIKAHKEERVRNRLSGLGKDQKFINALKTALAEKLAANSDLEETEELYMNQSETNMESKNTSSDKSSDDLDDIYQNAAAPPLPKRTDRVKKVALPKGKKPPVLAKPKVTRSFIRPSKELVDDYVTPKEFDVPIDDYIDMNKPTPSKPALDLRPSIFDANYLEAEKIDEHTKSKVCGPTSPIKSIPDYLDLDTPKKEMLENYLEPREFGAPTARKLICSSETLPRVSSSRHKQSISTMRNRPLPEVPKPKQIRSPDHDHQEYVDIDDKVEVPGNQRLEQQKLELQRQRINEKLPEKRVQKIQDVPLPPIPSDGLPRPPRSIPRIDLPEEFNQLILMDQSSYGTRSFISSYSSEKFYRNTNRNGAEKLLSRPELKEGTFLVRPTSSQHYCTIALRYRDRVYQLAVEKSKSAGAVVLGEVEFPSLTSLITYYKSYPMRLLNNSGCVNVRLTDTLPDDLT